MKILLFANTDWYLFNFRLSLAEALREAGHELLLVSPHGPLGSELRRLGFRWIAAPMSRRSLNPVRELITVLWLRQLMNKEAVDLVHGFTIKSAIYGPLMGRSIGGCARIGAVTGMGFVFTNESILTRLLRPLIRFLFRIAFGGTRARLIVENHDDERIFLEAGLIEPEKIRVIRGVGVDCVRFQPGGTPRANDRFRALLPGRILWDKGIAEFVEASRILKARGCRMEFLLAGSTDPDNPASIPDATLASWSAEGVVRQLGHVSDMPALLHTVDAVVLPSYREGLPTSLIEAAACGLPLVATDVPGCREVVTDGEDGLLVPSHDSHALADAIERLHDDPSLCERLGAAAREKTLRHFDVRIVIEQTLAVYRELLDEADDR